MILLMEGPRRGCEEEEKAGQAVSLHRLLPGHALHRLLQVPHTPHCGSAHHRHCGAWIIGPRYEWTSIH